MTEPAVEGKPFQLYDIGMISDFAPDHSLFSQNVSWSAIMPDANSNDCSHRGSWPSRANALYLLG